MPLTIGSSSGGSSGVSRRGVIIPAGSLDVWKAARDAHATQRVEVACLGDSTMYGQSSNWYPWPNKVRQLSIAAGYTDGGRGYWNVLLANENDPAGSAPDGSLVASRTGFAIASMSAMLIAYGSSTAGDTITFNIKTQYCRLFYLNYPTVAGSFTYSVNGGTAVRVDCTAPNTSYGPQQPLFVYLGPSDGLTTGTNTLTITNLGGAYESPPKWWNNSAPANSGAGNIPAGTYYYTATKGTQGVNETAHGVVQSITLASSSTVTASFENGTAGYPAIPSGTYNLYRGTSSSGPWKYIGSTTTASNSGLVSVVDNLATAGTASAPSSPIGTPINTSAPMVNVMPAPMNATGIVYNNYAVPGAQWGMWSGPDTNTQGQAKWQVPLGLSLPTNTTGGFEALPPDPTPNASHPALTMLCLGVNDVSVLASTDVSYVQQRCDYFLRLCRNAGTDPLILLEHMRGYNGQQYQYAGLMRKAISDVARAWNVATIDIDQALSLPYQNTYNETGAHLTNAGYDAIAQVVWNAIGPVGYP